MFKMQIVSARMLNLAAMVSVLAAGSAGVMGQPAPAPPAAAAATNAPGPKIQFETPVYDFGRVKAGEPARHTYVFTNTGDALLIINSVQPQCGCTAAGEWTKQVEPGKTGSIPIQFNTAGMNGPVFKQIPVNCNVTNQTMVMLQLKGTVYKPVDLTPPMAVLNVMPDTDTASVVVTITNNTEEPLMLFGPESNNRMFAAELKTNTPGKGYQLTISTVPPLAMGSVQGQITLRTGWTNPPTISVPAVANVQPAIMVVPSYITLAPGPLPAGVTNSISVRNQSTNSVTLSEAVVSMPGVGTEIREMQAGKAWTLLVGFPQGFEVPAGRQVELTFKTSHSKFATMKVPVMQLPRPAAPPAAVVPPVQPTPAPVVAPAHQPPPPPPRPPLKKAPPPLPIAPSR
jgi:hypothetical protein